MVRELDRFVCELCFPKAKAIGDIGHFVLAETDLSYVLFEKPCHNGTLIAEWPKEDAPKPDPVTDENEDDLNINEVFVYFADIWMSKAEEFEKLINHQENWNVRSCWYIVESLKTDGYDPGNNGSVGFWLYDKIGKIIEEHTNEGG